MGNADSDLLVRASTSRSALKWLAWPAPNKCRADRPKIPASESGSGFAAIVPMLTISWIMPRQNPCETLPFAAMALVMQANNHSSTPFPPFPCASRYVAIGSVEEALDRVQRAVTTNEGISLVVGPPGTGKSLICTLLNQHFSETHRVCVMGEMPITDAESFHRHLVHFLGIDVSQSDDINLQLKDALTSDEIPVHGLLVLIDEAQSLTPDALEAIRTITNISSNGQPCVSTVLIASNKLDETLAVPSLEAFTQRIATRCYLHALNADETRTYIRNSIQRCGSEPESAITDEATGAIHHACSGIPRLINQLMTEAIDCADEVGEMVINDEIVDRAWANLQQLPSPIVEEKRFVNEDAAPVEFGSLVDSENFSDLSSTSDAEQREDEDAIEQEAAVAEQVVLEAEEIAEPAEQPTAETMVTSESQRTTVEEIEQNAFALEAIEMEVPELDAADPVTHEVAPAIHDVAPAMPDVAPAMPDVAPAMPDVASEAIVSDIMSSAATAMWSEEPEYEPEPTDPPRTHAASMRGRLPGFFGEFDQEEDVAVEVPANQQAVVALQASELKRAQLEPDDSPINEFSLQEEILHERILQMNEMAAQARFGAIEESNIAGDPLSTSQVAAPASVEWMPEKPSMMEIDRKDDSDLLIIEDEISVVRAPRGIDRTLPEQPVTVDFQAMLAKMRSM